MRFTIGSQMYEAATLDRLHLSEILRLEVETVGLGRPMKWSQIRGMASALDGLTPEQIEAHDDGPWVIALVIWASRLRQGEQISFADSIDFELADLVFIPDPEDHKPGKAPSRPTHKGSAARKGSAAKAASAARKKTSARPSSDA